MSSEPTPTDPALLGLLALVAADRGEQGSIPTEIILSRVGLGNAEISAVVGKSPDAVRKMIERAKSSPKKKKRGPSKK